jgi:hypothetical protein
VGFAIHVVHFLDADGLAGEDLAEIDFLLAQTDSSATRNHDGLVVERIVDIRRPRVDASGRLVDLGRTFRVQSFMRAFVAFFRP